MRISPALFVLLAIFTAPTTRAADDWKDLESKGKTALEKNQATQAENFFMQAAEKAEAFGKEDERYARSLRWLGIAAMQLQDYPNADFAYTRLTRADQARLGSNDLAVADDLVHLTEVSAYTEQFTRGQESIDAATAIVESRTGRFSPALGFCLAARATLELQENRLDSATTNLQRALEIFDQKGTVMHFSGADLQMKQAYFQAPQSYVAEVLNNLAVCELREKKYPDAEETLQRAIKIIEHEYGKNSAHLVNSLFNLGNVYLADRHYPEAEMATRRALALLRKVDPSHPMVAQAQALLDEIQRAEALGGAHANVRTP